MYLIPIVLDKFLHPINNMKKSIFINDNRTASANRPAEQKESTQSASQSKTQMQNRVITNKETGATYEFRPVISPMFGVTSENPGPRPVVTTQTSPVHNSSVLGTIVSPIYGISPNEERPQVIVSENVTDEEIENFSLEDLLGEEKEPAAVEEEDDDDLGLEINIPFVEKEIVDDDAAQKIMENARTTDQFLQQEERQHQLEELRDDLTFETDEPTVENIVFGTLKKEKKEPVVPEDAKVEDITLEEEAGANADEIRQAMKEFSEEEYFEKENQPTLFDL